MYVKNYQRFENKRKFRDWESKEDGLNLELKMPT